MFEWLLRWTRAGKKICFSNEANIYTRVINDAKFQNIAVQMFVQCHPCSCCYHPHIRILIPASLSSAYIVLKITWLQTKCIYSANYLVKCCRPLCARAPYVWLICEKPAPHSISSVRSAYDSIAWDGRHRIRDAHDGRCTNVSELYVCYVSASVAESHAVFHGRPATKMVPQWRNRTMAP